MSELPADIQDTPDAHPEAVKDFWLQCARGADSRGHLEMLPTRKARTPREVEQARKQNYALTRRVFGMPDNYDRIEWGHGREMVDKAFVDRWFDDVFPGDDAA